MSIAISWDGFKWFIRQGKRFEQDRAVLSKNELSVLRVLKLLASREHIFVDVGAHVGYYTVRMSPLYKYVYAFEPNPENRENLLRNIQLNNLGNVTVYPFALGESEGEGIFYLASSGSSFIKTHEHYESITVPIKRMDDIIEKVDVVKIDVEGYEWNVLRGMQRIINDCKPTLIIEHHEFRHYNINTYPLIRKTLNEKGYMEIYLTEPHRLYYHKDRDLNKIKQAIANHWINHCIENIKMRRAWYYGLPYTWWWGMSLVDFIYEIQNHVLNRDEPEWILRLSC